MNNQEFIITIDYDKNSDKPERVFNAMASTITEFSNIDKMLCNSVSANITTRFEIESIENGSIIAKFKQVLEAIDDEAIENLDWKRLIGGFLLKGKYLILDNLKEETDAPKTSASLIQLQEDIFTASKEIKLSPLKPNNKIPTTLLIKRLDGINKAFSELNNKDTITYSTNTHKINTKFNPYFSYESYKELITENKIVTNQAAVLTVKKPDYLGESQWEFIFNEASVPVKIADEKWLKKFQNREISVQPKDSIKCMLEITTSSLPHSKTVASYVIKKIIDVVPHKESSQELLNLT